ncbi:DNA-binding FrmR family transcriptional regulator [Natranaerovirga hydrolytica]|uniref:Copper-sensing transcriptional repressor CsoR n=1 Tax=Natranaerovirga hydrolytica TaxID=680378 RepID=A0A4R1MRA2_9FIRM|nr:metal-sensing transcriptional repressor [Natranaerovirga hydrolytica]TCK92423.1 DNA-binding FrmR family transcriptional regulator [Natranaerovirga hydrolytica]
MDNKKTTNLLKTARGQLDGIIKMIEEERYCVDISKQILSVQGLLKKSNLEILNNHMRGCVKDAMQEGNGDEKIEEIMIILDKYIK